MKKYLAIYVSIISALFVGLLTYSALTIEYKAAAEKAQLIPATDITEYYPYKDGAFLGFPLKEGDFYYSGTRVKLSSWYYMSRADLPNGEIYRAINIPCRYGSPVFAIADGQVASAEYNSITGMGLKIVCSNGLEIFYQHLGAFNPELFVKAGKVVKGDLIALIGRSGRTTGTNLRIEARYRRERVCISNFFGVRWYKIPPPREIKASEQ